MDTKNQFASNLIKLKGDKYRDFVFVKEEENLPEEIQVRH